MFNVLTDREILVEYLSRHAPNKLKDVDKFMTMPLPELALSMKLNHGHRIVFGLKEAVEHAGKKEEHRVGGAARAKELLKTYSNCSRPPVPGKSKDERETPGKILAAVDERDAHGALKRLLAEGLDINAANKEGLTALMMACVNFKFPVLNMLVAHGANVNERPEMGATCLDLTLTKKYKEKPVMLAGGAEMLDKYKDMSGRPNTLQWLDEHGGATGAVCDQKLVEATDTVREVLTEAKPHERVHILEKMFDPRVEVGGHAGSGDVGGDSDTDSESESGSGSDSSYSGSESESEEDEVHLAKQGPGAQGRAGRLKRELALQKEERERARQMQAQADLIGQMSAMDDGLEAQVLKRFARIFLSLDTGHNPQHMSTASNIMQIFALCAQDRSCRELLARIGTLESLLTFVRLSLTSKTPIGLLEGTAELVSWMAKEASHREYAAKLAKNAEALVLMLDRYSTMIHTACATMPSQRPLILILIPPRLLSSSFMLLCRLVKHKHASPAVLSMCAISISRMAETGPTLRTTLCNRSGKVQVRKLMEMVAQQGYELEKTNGDTSVKTNALRATHALSLPSTDKQAEKGSGKMGRAQRAVARYDHSSALSPPLNH
jgi:hypothetical protein